MLPGVGGKAAVLCVTSVLTSTAAEGTITGAYESWMLIFFSPFPPLYALTLTSNGSLAACPAFDPVGELHCSSSGGAEQRLIYVASPLRNLQQLRIWVWKMMPQITDMYILTALSFPAICPFFLFFKLTFLHLFLLGASKNKTDV